MATRRGGRKNAKKGVQFTLMVVGMSCFYMPSSRISNLNCVLGASGTGRSTFVNTLCESEVLSHKISDNPETAHIEEGIKIKPVNVGKYNQHNSRNCVQHSTKATELEEDGVRIALTIVDTPGFGDNIDNDSA